ncbi:MAG: FeoB-associated Cys-rich membrane protein [Lachnospiraceae bacterium]|nr:FeoB-associated Cys-rich membrane protein [Lachnospiraceae bacterium]
MISWLLGNLGTIVISFLLLLVVAGIILSMIRDKKMGRSSCGGNCSHCNLCNSCRSAKNPEGYSSDTTIEECPGFTSDELRSMLMSGRAAEAGKLCACKRTGK